MTITFLILFRLSNQDALNAKVQEAVNVYDEYVKTKTDDEGIKPEGDKTES
jgi:hypothetical protein